MIARVWRGWTRAENADQYDDHYRHEVLPALRLIDGFRGARLLRRPAGQETEFMSVTFFESLEAVQAFAGADHEAAVITDSARRVLIRSDERVTHYEVSVEI